jgi:cytidine deaminase
VTIGWPRLRAAALDVAARAHAPYSHLRVGAAGQTADGTVVVGCNVENASYGLTLCAECGLVSALHASGAGGSALHSSVPAAPASTASAASAAPAAPAASAPALVAVSVVAADGDPLLPCGRCRQLLLEAGGPELLVDTPEGPVPLRVLLPSAFSAADLAVRRDQDGGPDQGPGRDQGTGSG